uniref:Putative secreted protein n=1 Tax=Anopheles marajoara TaxID=58244 RepID=A0A2M4CDP7_9DIPT
MLAAVAAGVALPLPPVGGASAPGACIMQSCQTRSGRMTAADLLISADDILYGLPRSFDGDSGTVSGGVIIDL